MPPLTVWNANFCLVDNRIFLWPIYSFFFPFLNVRIIAGFEISKLTTKNYRFNVWNMCFLLVLRCPFAVSLYAHSANTVELCDNTRKEYSTPKSITQAFQCTHTHFTVFLAFFCFFSFSFFHLYLLEPR